MVMDLCPNNSLTLVKSTPAITNPTFAIRTQKRLFLCMFLREKSRTKDGKTHRYWSVVENRRVSGRRVVQRQVLYLGELNDNQRAGWVRTIEVVSGKEHQPGQLALFPDD